MPWIVSGLKTKFSNLIDGCVDCLTTRKGKNIKRLYLGLGRQDSQAEVGGQ